MQRIPAVLVFITLVTGVITVGVSARAADQVNSEQAAIDALNDKKALIEAQDALLKAQAALAKDRFPAFPDGFGKTGALTIEPAERDKFHVTARSADAFKKVAKEIAKVLNAEAAPVVLLTDADRNAVSVYWTEKAALNRITAEVERLLGPPPAKPAIPESFGTAILGAGSLLTQLAQFGQLFRTDKSLAFTDSLLPDELLLDLIAVEAKDKVLYPTGSLDALLLNGAGTSFGKSLASLLERRSLLELSAGKAPAAKATLAELDALASRMASTDPTTKLPTLLTVLRGDLVMQFLEVTNGRSLSVKIPVKGGASLKTSSIWRSDRLYASGGVVASYRLSSLEPLPFGSVLKAGVVTEESGFVRVPLD